MKELSTDLVGADIEPRYYDLIGQPNGPWPVNAPNLSGEHIATVRAAWTEQGNLKVLAETPSGLTFETFMVNVKVKPRRAR